MRDQMREGRPHPQQVAVCTKAADKPDGRLRGKRMAAKRLACVNVGEMDFHHGKADGGNGIPECHAGMGVGGRVEDHSIRPPHGVVKGVDQLSLPVMLSEAYLAMQLARQPSHRGLDVR